eukprot:Tbor_TRINITY_DN5318_c0_g5::TRINITY_DN5318_c0_g5_i2::g.4703::m.4703
MTIKWASFLFWHFMNPAFYAHHQAYRKKVIIDRFLEKRSVWLNIAIGSICGLSTYLILSPLFPSDVNKTMKEINSDASELLKILKLDASKELPMLLLLRAKEEIVAKVHVTNDKADVRRQMEEMARVRETVIQAQNKINELSSPITLV